MFTFPVTFFGGIKPEVVWTDVENTGSNGSSFTYTVDIGPEHPTRLVVYTYWGVSFISSFVNNASTTINSSSPTHVLGTAGSTFSMFRHPVPTGTTASINVQRSAGSFTAMQVMVWVITNLQSSTPIDTDQLFAADPSTTLTTLPGAVVVGYTFQNGTGSTAFTWTGLTEDVLSEIGGSTGAGEWGSAATANDVSGSSLFIQAACSRAGSSSLAVASWR